VAEFISFPLARAAVFLLLLLLQGAPTPPRLLYFGGGKYQKRKSPVESGMTFGHVGVGVGVVEVAVHLFKNFSFFACLIFQCFLDVRVIEPQFVSLARCPWLAKV
jgi:hypothetical protein